LRRRIQVRQGGLSAKPDILEEALMTMSYAIASVLLQTS
jgi:hypothetical protein